MKKVKTKKHSKPKLKHRSKKNKSSDNKKEDINDTKDAKQTETKEDAIAINSKEVTKEKEEAEQIDTQKEIETMEDETKKDTKENTKEVTEKEKKEEAEHIQTKDPNSIEFEIVNEKKEDTVIEVVEARDLKELETKLNPNNIQPDTEDIRKDKQKQGKFNEESNENTEQDVKENGDMEVESDISSGDE